MKKQILFVLAFYCLNVSDAQPILHHIEDFKIGSRIVSYKIPPDGILAGMAGSNIMWDYSAVQLSSDTIVQEIIQPGATLYGNKFPTATYVESNSDGSMGYIQIAGNKNNLTGFITDGGLVYKYSDPYTFVGRPFTYLDMLTDTFSRNCATSNDSLYGTGFSMTIADSWGTLKLPQHTYQNVLRVKYIQEFQDTAFNSGLITNTKVTTYAWFNDDYRSSLFKIDSIAIKNPFYADTFATVQLLKREETTGIADHMNEEEVKVSYADQKLTITGNLDYGDVITISVSDICGITTDKIKIVQQQKYARCSISLEKLQYGEMYIAKIAIQQNGRILYKVLKIVK